MEPPIPAATGRRRSLREDIIFNHAHTPASGPDPRPSLRPVVVPLSGLLVAQFVAGLSGTIVATSIPTIMRALDGPPSHATWLVAATILANTATTPIWGKLGDLFATKRILQIAIGLFVVGSLLAGSTGSTGTLIAARAIQGIGLGGLLSLIAVVIAGLVEPRQRGRVNGWLTSVQTTATIAGPVLGGLIVQLPGLGWRWCFFLGVPFAVASIVIIAVTLKLPARSVVRGRADWAGALLVGSSIAALLICVTVVSDAGWSPSTAAIGGYGLLALVGVVIVELRAEDPVIPLRLLAGRTPLLCVIAAVCVGTNLFGGTVFVSQYLQTGLGMPPTASGLLLIPMAVGTVATALLAGRFTSRTGRIRPVLIGGALMLVIGNIVLSQVNLWPVPLAIGGTVLIAAGLGALSQNLVLTAQNSVPFGRVGSISSSVMFFNFLGGTVGLVIFGAVLAAEIAALVSAGSSTAQATVTATPAIFALAAGVSAPALIAVLALPGVLLRTTR
jgi:MFS family permease